MTLPKNSKYIFNPLLFLIVGLFFVGNFYFSRLSNNFNFISFFISLVTLHYLCNLVHIASHNSITRPRWINDLISRICCIPALAFTHIDFKITHLEHHKHTTDPVLDPDWKITNTGSVFLLPFRIVFYKDIFFWKFCISNKKFNYLREYIIDRIIQLVTVSLIFVNFDFAFKVYWILPLFIVGILNAAFLYFYPHYEDRFERFLRSKNRFIAWRPVQMIYLYIVDVSRELHRQHHLKPTKNYYYFPELWILRRESED
jgi:beta-carotene hydroxylase